MTNRPSWDEYFLLLAKLAATRSTCLATPVGAVIVKDQQVLATGYNGPPSGSAHCVSQGFCYPDLRRCDASKVLPSRAVHAEANAIAQAAKHCIPTNGAVIYVTLEPCLSCLKLIMSAGIQDVYYETSFNTSNNLAIREMFVQEQLVRLHQIGLSQSAIAKAITTIYPSP